MPHLIYDGLGGAFAIKRLKLPHHAYINPDISGNT